MFGSGLGSAVGQIIIRTDDVTRAQNVVLAASQRMTNAMNAVSTSFTSQDAAAQRLEAGVMAIGIAGVVAAQKIKQIEAVFRVISGSVQQANTYMNELHKIADETHQPFLSLVNAATQILPAIKGTNAEFTKTVDIIQRLSILDPEQGLTGAAFAVRKFLMGDAASLARQFALGRSNLDSLLVGSQGNVNKSLDSLSLLLDRLNLTHQSLVDLGNEGIYAFQDLRDAVLQMMASAFTPFLNQVLVPGITKMNDLFRAMQEGKGDAYALAAAVGAIALAVTKLGGLSIGRIAIGAVALDLGANLAKTVVQAIGTVPGNQVDPKLRADSGYDFWEVIKERLGQVFLIFANMVVDFIGSVAKIIVSIGHFVNGFVDSLQSAILGVNIFAAKIQLIGAQISQWIADNITGDKAASDAAKASQKELLTKLYGPAAGTAMQEPVTTLVPHGGPYGGFDNPMQRLNYNKQQNAAANPGGSSGFDDGTAPAAPVPLDQQGLTGQMQQLMDKFSKETIAPTSGENKAIDDTLASLKVVMDKWLVAQGVGAPAQVAVPTTATLAAGGDKNAMIAEVATGFADARQKIIDMRTQFAADQTRLVEDQKRQDARAAQDFETNRTREVADFNSSLAQSDAQAADAEKNSQKTIDNIKRDYQEKQIDDQKKLNATQEKNEQDHQLRIKQILQDSSAAIEDAIASRDGKAAQAAMLAAQRDITHENESFDLQKAQDQKTLDQQKQTDAREYQEKLQAAQDSLAALKADNAARHQAQIDDFNLRIAREDADNALSLARDEADRKLKNARAKEDLDKKIQDTFDQAAVDNQAWNQFKDLLGDARQGVVDWAMGVSDTVDGLVSSVKSAASSAKASAAAAASYSKVTYDPTGAGVVGGTSSKSGETTSQKTTATNTGGLTHTTVSPIIAAVAQTQAQRLAAYTANQVALAKQYGYSFAGGGDPPLFQRVLVGEYGPEWAVFNRPATIYSHGTTPNPVSQSAGDTYDLSGMHVYTQATDVVGIATAVKQKIVEEMKSDLTLSVKRRSSLHG